MILIYSLIKYNFSFVNRFSIESVRELVYFLTNSTCFHCKSILTATLHSKRLLSHAQALPLQQALAPFPSLSLSLSLYVASPCPAVAACFCWLLSMYFQIVWLGVLISLSVFMFISETHTHTHTQYTCVLHVCVCVCVRCLSFICALFGQLENIS